MPGGETWVDPEEAAAGGRQLVIAAEYAGETIDYACREIRGIQLAAPWGSDEPGAAFGRAYAPSAATVEASYHMHGVVAEMGIDIQHAASNVEQLDEAIGRRVSETAVVTDLPGGTQL